MSRAEALRQVLDLLVAAAEAAHQAELTQLGLAIQSVLLDAQRLYRGGR
jgi:hypothetical protein